MSSEKSLTPQIRFKGFTEAWEQRKAIDLFKDVSEKGFDNLPVLSATQDRGMVYRDENGINISHDKKNELTYKHVIPGQFVIHLRSFQGGFAHSSIEGITSPAYTVFRFSNESQHDDIFWKYIFMSERFIKSLETVTYGIRDGRSISYSEFLGLPFAVPEKEEESRVGYFLKKYDSLITLHQRKLDALKKIKSALLEKMFPKDGSNIPEIRFTGFTEAWEQRKAIDLFKDVSEKGFDNLPVLSATQDRGMVYRDENGINISHDKKNELTYKHVIPGQFVIHLRSFQGGFAHSSIEGITSPAYTVFRFSNESQHDDIFWKYIFMSERFIKSLETVTYGIRDGRSISYSEFLGLPFAVPEKEEESRVGYFLKKYDSLITLHQRKLDALKKIKSALLEKMFV